MLWGFAGGLELRRSADGTIRLRGSFPYGAETELTSTRREVIAPRAFGSRIAAGADVHLLVQHDWDRPLASRASGSLDLTDGDDALRFEATISESLRTAPYVADFLGALDAGLIRGLSPGFRVARAPGTEEIQSEGNVIKRTVRQAELIELSAVTLPAYSQAQVEARRWSAAEDQADTGLFRTIQRWRA
ncbi:MAG: HK97 family phage prohead protease [Pseudomonadota bacterium]